MATITGHKRRPLWLTVFLLLAVIVVSLIAFQWVTSLVLGLVRLVLIVIALAAMARIGLFLLRKGE